MGRVINIANKLDREPRFLVVDDTHRYKVNCTKNVVMKVMDLDEKEPNYLDEMLKLLIGGEALHEIEEMGLPYDNWVIIMKAAVAIATNKSYDEVENDFRGEEEAKPDVV